MWLVAFFDLPVKTKRQRRNYVRFRNRLLDEGFNMVQYSVYVRNCASPENLEVHSRRVEGFLPPEGEVRVLSLTHMQYARMKVYFGKEAGRPEKPPEQLSFW
jgi:CRISPR-associated protein Cas2